MANLLMLARSVSNRLPLSTTVTTVVGNTEPLIAQLLEIMQEEGDEMMQCHDWSELYKTWTMTLVTDPDEITFESDHDRYVKNADFWRSGSDVSPLSGPVSSDDWHYIVDISGNYPGYWRPIRLGIEITGVPLDETVDVEYISKNWIIDLDGSTGKAAFAADTDTIIFDENMFKAGIRWRWKQSKGLAYAEDMETYERLKEKRIAADRAARPMPTNRSITERYKAAGYSWPGQVTES